MSGLPPRHEQYAQALRRNYCAELSDDLELCPRCGRGWVIPGTAGARVGICQRCHLRALAEAERLAAAEISAQQDYEKERQRLSRARRKARDE